MTTRRQLVLSLCAGTGLPLAAASSASRIRRIETVRYRAGSREGVHLEIEAESGVAGVFGPLGWTLPQIVAGDLPILRKLLAGKDALDRSLEFETLWSAMFPGKPLNVYAKGIDPLTGANILGTTRTGRFTPTGLRIMAVSAVDNALWDLRAKLLGKPLYEVIGNAKRPRLRVYSRVGEGRDLAEARRIARERFDKGQKHQKWYFVYGPKDGREGMRKNIELVRVLREELGGSAALMFDNHSMRHEIGPDWSVQFAKAILPYKVFWLEEPTAPEDLEGYARIKGETGITIAGGEHHFTRWQILPLLERRCIDWIQSDPDWCGGISEWLRIAAIGAQRNIKVMPHCDNFMSVLQCVASQPESLCPMVEYNDGVTEDKMSYRTRVFRPVNEVLDAPREPGFGPDLDRKRLVRVG